MARSTSSSSPSTRGSSNYNLSRLIKLLITLLFVTLVAIQLSLGSQLSKLDPPQLHNGGRKPIQYDDKKQIIRHNVGNAHEQSANVDAKLDTKVADDTKQIIRHNVGNAYEQSANIDAKQDTKVAKDEERLIKPNTSDGTLQGRERLWQMLTTRNVTQVYASYWNSVPQWDTVLTNIHRTNNPSPIIHGLETCEAFQRITADNPSQRRIAPAGLFNTGTNLLSVLLEYNCQNPHRVAKFKGNAKRGHGNEWQTLWGKHNLARYRGAYTTSKKPNYRVDELLPIVLVRNPYGWMKSMCRNPYTASWEGQSNAKTCPKLRKENNEWNGVHVKFGPGQTNHKSLGHLFNDWYGDYFYSNSTMDDGSERNISAPFPRLMIRFEDIIFFPKEVTEAVCKCAGGIIGHRADDKDVANGTFHYVVRSAKAGFGHGPQSHRNGLIDSWIRYGSVNPQSEYSSDDLALAQAVFDPLIMDAFAYD